MMLAISQFGTLLSHFLYTAPGKAASNLVSRSMAPGF